MADDQTSSKDSQEDGTGQPASTWRQILSGWVFKFIVIPLIGMAMSAVLLSRISEWWTGPKAYHVYVVGDFNGRDRQVADEIWEGINKTFDASKAPIDGTSVTLQRIDDKGSAGNAKEVSEILAKRSDTLMVIGHMSSSKSLAALPAYLLTEPPVPVILPTETNPNLVPPKITEDRQYYPIFRLSPTDKEQAKTVAKLVFNEKKNAKSFWIIDDATDPTYSHFLIGEFIASLQEENQVRVLFSSRMEIPSLQVLEKFNIDCIFFTGKWLNARILLEQVDAIWPDKKTAPMVILSDSVVEKAIYKGIQTNLVNVYISHPMSADRYLNKNSMITVVTYHMGGTLAILSMIFLSKQTRNFQRK